LIGGDASPGGTDGDADFNIASGAGSDFVHINSMSDADSDNAAEVVAVTAVAEVQTITIVRSGAADAADVITVIVDGVTYSGNTAAALETAIDAGFAGTSTEAAGVITITGVAAGTSFVISDLNFLDVTAVTANPTSGTIATTVAGVLVGDFVDAPSATVGAWAVGVDTGAATFVDRVLYEATLTVNFAGFEETVTVETTAANNFAATQLDLMLQSQQQLLQTQS